MNPAFFFSNRRSSSTRNEKPTREVEQPHRRSISAILGQTRPNVLNPKNRAHICVPNTNSGVNISSGSGLSSDDSSSSSFSVQFSRRDSSFRMEPKRKQDNIVSKMNFSTHGHILSDISNLIDKINSSKYNYTIQTFPQCEENTDDIESIVAFSSQPGVIQGFDADTTEKLLNIAANNTLRDITDIPKPLLYGDTYSPLSIKNWRLLFYFHKLVSIIIRNLDQPIVERWVDETFILKLVNLLNSPDPNEQTSTEVLIQQIFDTFDSKKTFIFNCMINLIMSHIDGVSPFVCLPFALKFFLRFFSNLRGTWNKSYKNIFRAVFFRLFATDFIHEYYQPLSALCQLFYQNDSAISLWALEFMLKHWPKSNSSKHVIYLHHITILSASLRIGGVERSVIQLFSQIGLSLTSYNFKVATAALQVCSDANFLCMFTPMFPLVIPPLLKQLSLLTDHWSNDVRNLMRDAFQVVYPIDAKLDKASDQNADPTGAVRGNWMAIYQSAISMDTALVTDLIPKKIMLIE